MKSLTVISLVLMIVGSLNWLLVGLINFNLVTYLFGAMPYVSQIVYLLVGLAGVFGIFMLVTLSERRQDACVPGHGHLHPSI